MNCIAYMWEQGSWVLFTISNPSTAISGISKECKDISEITSLYKPSPHWGLIHRVETTGIPAASPFPDGVPQEGGKSAPLITSSPFYDFFVR